MASDEELADTPMVEEKPLDPAEAKEKKEKESEFRTRNRLHKFKLTFIVRYYRHKLQKGFLSRDDVPGDEEITVRLYRSPCLKLQITIDRPCQLTLTS